MEFSPQLDRIKTKFKIAGAKDKSLKAFGSDAHHYKLNVPLPITDVKAFELKLNISLPLEYVAFISEVGNGGPGPYGAAGPDYGIYALGKTSFMKIDADVLSSPCQITSRLTKSEWEDLTEFAKDKGPSEMSESDHQQYDALFSGLLPIGFRGCTGQTMLALNGADRGRIIYVDQDLYMPSIAGNKNFLDWYEQWLDTILDGTALLTPQ